MSEQPATPQTPAATPLGAEMVQASAKVQAIVDAAERAAAGLRAETEQRARERIAEADRAADNRVQAAEAEARDILAQAQKEAEELRRAGREEARNAVLEASEAARDVLRRGTELSREIEQLGTSLRRNAQVILHDVKHAHDQLSRQLADALPEGAGADLPVRARRTDDEERAARRERPSPSGPAVFDHAAGDRPVAPRTPRPPASRGASDRAPVDVADVPELGELEIPEFSREYVPQRHRRRR